MNRAQLVSTANVHRHDPHQNAEKWELGVVSSEASGAKSGHRVDIPRSCEALQPHGDHRHRLDLIIEPDHVS